TLVVVPGEELRLRALYEVRRFGDGTGRMLEHLRVLLTAMSAAGPETLVEELPLLTADESRRVVEEPNATASPFPAATVHELFAAVAAADPGAVAVEEPDL